jgi:hypothetical protein
MLLFYFILFQLSNSLEYFDLVLVFLAVGIPWERDKLSKFEPGVYSSSRYCSDPFALLYFFLFKHNLQ